MTRHGKTVRDKSSYANMTRHGKTVPGNSSYANMTRHGKTVRWQFIVCQYD